MKKLHDQSAKHMAKPSLSVPAFVGAWLFGLVTIMNSCQPHASSSSSKFHRLIPYPKSSLIDSLIWTSEPYRYPGTNSDMHWWTWHSDSAVYIVDDDGKNFDGPAYLAHVLKISGTPPNHRVETINDFQDPAYNFRSFIPKELVRRYVCGIVSTNQNLYVTVYDYDWNLPHKILNRDSLYNRIRQYSPWHHLDSALGYTMGFIDSYSKHYGVAGIIQSTDNGKTWTNIPNPETPRFLGPNFAALAFLTFGPGNTQNPQELQPYLYAISNDSNWESGDNIFLARVHRDSIVHRAAWQFFNGNAKSPSWTKQEQSAKPIFTDVGHAGHPTITYNKELKRYLLAVASDVYPHREDHNREERKKWDWASEMQLYEGPTPWGPWAIFYNNPQWGGKDHTCYLPQIPSAWLSPDGLGGTMMFAGDYINRQGEYYGLMTQSFKLLPNANKK